MVFSRMGVLLTAWLGVAVVAAGLVGQIKVNRDVTVRWVSVPDLPNEIELLESVYWEPLDTVSLRKLIVARPNLIQGKSVLEIGTGSGLIAMCCCEAGAASVTATDINPNAIRCARRNAQRGGYVIDLRLVASGPNEDSGGFSQIRPGEKFDLIISNPPWEDAEPKAWSEYALYDPDFELLRSILSGCRNHLKPGGKLMLAYGCVEAIRVTRRLAAEMQLAVYILDDRDPESLPDLFLPGMLLGVMPESRPPTPPNGNE